MVFVENSYGLDYMAILIGLLLLRKLLVNLELVEASKSLTMHYGIRQHSKLLWAITTKKDKLWIL